MRKKYLAVLISALVLMSMIAGCGTKDSAMSETKKVSKKNSPQTVMDLFDGDSRVWYFLDRSEVSYDSKIEGVFISENKKFTEIYYALNSGAGIFEDKTVFEQNNSPFVTKYTMEEFDDLSDEEIIDAVKSRYANAGETYTCDVDTNGGNPYHIEFEKTELPFQIYYDGTLDASGNSYESEYIHILDHYIDQFSNYIPSGIYVHEIIGPIEIKGKEYVGITDGNDLLITENTYSSFESISFDEPAEE